MTLYGFEVSEEASNSYDSTNRFTLIEDETSSIKLSYTLDLHNNQHREISLQSDQPFKKIKKKQTIKFIVKDVVTFTWIVGEKKVYYVLNKLGSKELLKYWFYHTLSPLLLTFENTYFFLHAGGVEIDEKAILFVADSFGGKSTLTDFFIKKGHLMISDDKIGTYEENGKIISVPSYPYHRPYRKVEDLGKELENFASKKREIYTIFNLVKSDQESEIKITKAIGIEKFKVLKYATDIDLSVHQELQFKSIGNIANKVKVYDITIPWKIERQEEVYQAIISFIKMKDK